MTYPDGSNARTECAQVEPQGPTPNQQYPRPGVIADSPRGEGLLIGRTHTGIDAL